MTRLTVRNIFILIIVLLTAVSVCEVQAQGKTRGRSPEKGLFGKSRSVKTKDKKVREPRKVRQAKKTQAKKEAKLKKDYYNYVDESKKRAFKIQTPEVQERMKQNQKDIKEREKNQKKKTSRSTKGAQKKYKK